VSDAVPTLSTEPLRRFAPYAAYKDSGLDWSRTLPNHWSLKRAKFLFQRMQRPVRNEDDVVTAFRDGVVTLRTRRRTEGFTFSDKEIGYQGVRSGDLVVHAMDGFAGAIGVSDADGKATPVYSVLQPLNALEIDNNFYAYFLRYLARSGFITSLAKGIRERSTEFRYAELKELWFPVLPLSEQRAIAAFLDRETRRIDALVAKKEQLIDLLQEKRTTLITRAVTKGLDPTVPMKDSGVEWLGEIPAHWEVKRLRHVGEAIIGLTYQPDDVVGPEEGALVLRASNVSDGRIVYGDNVYVRCAIPEHLRTRLGDIVICARSGSRDLIGKNAKIGADAVGITFGTFMIVFRSACNPYLFYVFNSALFEYQSGTFLTSTINQLTVGNLKDMTVPVPPGEEGVSIASVLDRESARVDTLIAKVRDAIDRLKELRTALISAAVTGKIDVREEAA
jgi:type I restriction enzyme S subunit